VNGDQDLDAGDFSSWLHDVNDAINGQRDAVVPCDGCVACCTSSQFVHIAPDETDTLAHIPTALLFPAPRMPHGHVLMGYDERGHCPMLIDNRCSIYEHRPRTCRTYDCRVFPAAGFEPDDEDKREIAERARRWRFSYSTETGRVAHDSVRAAASFLHDHPEALPDDAAPATATQRAVLSVEIHDAFVGGREPDPNEVRVLLRRRGPARTA
jgi:Fe-S-cluster containining protein